MCQSYFSLQFRSDTFLFWVSIFEVGMKLLIDIARLHVSKSVLERKTWSYSLILHVKMFSHSQFRRGTHEAAHWHYRPNGVSMLSFWVGRHKDIHWYCTSNCCLSQFRKYRETDTHWYCTSKWLLGGTHYDIYFTDTACLNVARLNVISKSVSER